MLRRSLTPRTLLVAVSIGLIVAGLSRLVDIRGPDRSEGRWEEMATQASRGDLNVVFVMIDTLRADRLSAYGYERETSPVFDALAESGILFRNVLAQSSWTKTSMAALWTAAHATSNGIKRYPHGLPDAARLPAEILRGAGFRTVGIYRNGWVAPNFGFAQGFDLYFRPQARQRGDVRQDNPSAHQISGTDEDLSRAAVEFLKSAGQERFFLYLHYMDVHQYVYDASVDFGTTYSDIYDSAIHWVDRNLGAIAGTLQQEGLMKRTLLVVTSDHGEAFGEHGTEGHGRNLYGETIEVPLLFVLPIRLEEGIEISTEVENIDVWPTLLELLDLPPLPNTEGRSLVPLIDAAVQGHEPAWENRPRFAYLDQTWGQRNADPRPLLVVEQDSYRLFHQVCDPEQDELYFLTEDPQEQENVAAEHPGRVAALQRLAKSALDAPAMWGGPTDVALNDFELGQLRALGYVIRDEEAPAEAQGPAGHCARGAE